MSVRRPARAVPRVPGRWPPCWRSPLAAGLLPISVAGRLTRERRREDPPTIGAVRGGPGPRRRPHRVHAGWARERAVPTRPGRLWTVDGARARALPAGRRPAGPCVTHRMGQAPPRLPPHRAPTRRSSTRPTIVAADGAGWSSDDGPATVELAAAVDPGGLRREVFGFLPYWELTDSSTTLDWEKLSTVAYFGVGAAGNGNLIKKNSDGSTTVGWSGWTSSKMTERHQRRPRQPRPGRADRPELRLVRRPGSPARRRCSAARPPGQPRPADRGGRARREAPTASTSTSSRSPRATPTSSPRSSARSARR